MCLSFPAPPRFPRLRGALSSPSALLKQAPVLPQDVLLPAPREVLGGLGMAPVFEGTLQRETGKGDKKRAIRKRPAGPPLRCRAAAAWALRVQALFLSRPPGVRSVKKQEGYLMAEKEPRFYACAECGVVVEEIMGSKTEGCYSCGGAELQKLAPNLSDGAQEKHLPVIAVDGNQVKVTVSSVEHPMVEVHYIDWVCLETEKGIQVHHLTVGEKPETVFGLADGDKVVAAYAYCNLHGFWKAEF